MSPPVIGLVSPGTMIGFSSKESKYREVDTRQGQSSFAVQVQSDDADL